MSTGLEREITNQAAYDRNRQHLADAGVVLPRLADLADPVVRLAKKSASIAGSDPDSQDAANLFRVHWHNDATRTGLAVHREAIEVRHLIGAQDGYIAGQFAARALVLGLKGGLIGLALGLPALFGLGTLGTSLASAVLPELSVGIQHWVAVLVLPLIVAVIAMLTARLTVMRTLKRML